LQHSPDPAAGLGNGAEQRADRSAKRAHHEREAKAAVAATSSAAQFRTLVTAHSAQKTPDKFEAKVGAKVLPTSLSSMRCRRH
jgi:hypothetical protein